MAGSFVFPSLLFAPEALKAGIGGAAISGGGSLSGGNPLSDLSGGGYVTATFGDSALWERELILAWNRFAGASDSGATPILVPWYNRLLQPIDPAFVFADTFGSATWVDDATAWTAEAVTATVSANAAVNATTMSFALTADVKLLGGEWVLCPARHLRLARL
jgi:hypothetical protein